MHEFVIFQGPFIIWILSVVIAFVAAIKMNSDEEEG